MSEAPATNSRFIDRDLLLLLAMVLGVLALFVGKAFTIDDPLFLWLARNVQGQPLDFYDFQVNWGGTVQAMHEVTMNPPLVGYVIAGVAAVFGWSEVALHGAFLLPAAVAVSGTWWLARRLTNRPLEAGLAALLSPVFLVSSSNVMCDTTMLALWCAAISCWVHGFDTNSGRWRWAAGMLVGVGFLAKYFAIALLPLLLVYGALRERRAGTWLLPLLLPVAVVIAYDAATHALYGHALFFGAAVYPSTLAQSPSLPAQVLVGLAFAGGCTIAALFYAPLLWSRRALGIGWGILMLLMLSPGGVRWMLSLRLFRADQWVWQSDLQLFLLALGGASVVGLAVAEWRRRRTPESALLALWVLGTLTFAAFLNWTNNGRSNLVLAPAVGILIVRRLEWLADEGWRPGNLARNAALAVSAVVAIAVAWSDYRWANDVRDAARSLAAAHVRPGSVTWANGDWGMQYYLEAEGIRTLDIDHESVARGEVLILSSNNTNPRILEEADAVRIDSLRHPEPPWVFTHSLSMGAGFYSSRIGPLPFVFGRARPDTYDVWRAKRAFQLEETAIAKAAKKRAAQP